MKKEIKKKEVKKKVQKNTDQLDKTITEIVNNKIVIFSKNLITKIKSILPYTVNDLLFSAKNNRTGILISIPLNNVYEIEKEKLTNSVANMKNMVVDEDTFKKLFYKNLKIDKYITNKYFKKYKKSKFDDILGCDTTVVGDNIQILILVKSFKVNFDYNSFISNFIYLPITSISFLSLNGLEIEY